MQMLASPKLTTILMIICLSLLSVTVLQKPFRIFKPVQNKHQLATIVQKSLDLKQGDYAIYIKNVNSGETYQYQAQKGEEVRVE